ncbi:MAG: response regulator transcription factor [Bacteroidota bacterium]
MELARKPYILLVEDELILATLIKDNLVKNGYFVHHESNGQDGLKHFFSEKPDLVILDVMLSKMDGFTISKTIRNTDRKTPILFLTAKIKTDDVIKGFKSGGNDYLRKPFALEELLIRIRALLSQDRLADQSEIDAITIFHLGAFVFDSRRLRLTHQSGHSHKLTARESELLKLFCLHANQVLTKSSILFKVWGDDSFFHSRSMDVFISRIRKYLKADPSIELINLRGVGYKLVVDA